MNYREERSVTADTKQSYVNQLDALLQRKQEEAAPIVRLVRHLKSIG